MASNFLVLRQWKSGFCRFVKPGNNLECWNLCWLWLFINKECSARHFLACWENCLILDLSTAVIACFFMTKFSGSNLYFSPCVIYLSALNPQITPPPYLTAVVGAACVRCYFWYVVIQAHKTGNMLHVQLFVHVETAALRSQVWQTHYHNLSQCIGVINFIWSCSKFSCLNIPSYICRAPNLGTTVLVCWLLFCSRPRTVVIFDDLILFPSHLSLSGVVCVINKLSTSYTINVYSILIILCTFFNHQLFLKILIQSLIYTNILTLVLEKQK